MRNAFDVKKDFNDLVPINESQFPDDWAETSLGKHVTHQKGFAFKSTEYVAEGQPVVRVSDFTDRSIDMSSCYYVDVSQVAKYNTYSLIKGDVVIATVGSWPSNPASVVGKAIKVPEDADKSLLNQNAVRLRGNETLDQAFLFYLLSQRKYQDYIVSTAQGSANQASITLNDIFSFSFNLPPLPEQKAIAHILGTLDDKIECNRRMNETLEQMAQAMFQSWFVDFDPVIDNALAVGNDLPEELQERAARRQNLGSKRKPLPKYIQKLFPAKFELTQELGWIPAGWEVITVGNEFSVTMGQSPPGSTYNESGDGIPFFQGRTDFGFRYPTQRIYCTEPKRFARTGDTLISVRAPVGDMNMAMNDCCIGRGVAAVRHKSGHRSYTYYTLRSMKSKFNKFEAEGTVFGSINQSSFNDLVCIKPHTQLIAGFEEIVFSIDERIYKSTIEICDLVSIRDILLPKLISGELRIEDAERFIECNI